MDLCVIVVQSFIMKLYVHFKYLQSEVPRYTRKIFIYTVVNISVLGASQAIEISFLCVKENDQFLWMDIKSTLVIGWLIVSTSVIFAVTLPTFKKRLQRMYSVYIMIWLICLQIIFT